MNATARGKGISALACLWLLACVAAPEDELVEERTDDTFVVPPLMAADERVAADEGDAGTQDMVERASALPADAGADDKPAVKPTLIAPPSTSTQVPARDFEWHLPPGFPVPFVPSANGMSEAKVALGRRLFYDPRLSDNQTQSCASCHRQALAFSDGRAHALGSTGELHPRSSQSLANVAYAASLTWANSLFAVGVVPEPLERQTLLPLYGDAPVELGFKSQQLLVARLTDVAAYRTWFADAFPEQEQPISAQNIGRALAAFERTLISGRSAFDRYVHDGDDSALTASAQRGYELFRSERLACAQCHGGFNLSDHVYSEPLGDLTYHNTGLYNIDGAGAYPEPNTGLYDVSLEPSDMGRFKAPTLRNIAVTAPYMHDGSIATLSEVLDHYAVGGRTIADGSAAGVGSASPLKDPAVHGFSLSADERADMLEFFASLTDHAFLTNPAFSDPWH